MNSVCPVLKGSSSFQELVLVENTRLSEQYFSAVQKFVVFDLGLTLLPVSGQTEASQLIAQIVSSEDKTTELQGTELANQIHATTHSWQIKRVETEDKMDPDTFDKSTVSVGVFACRLK